MARIRCYTVTRSLELSLLDGFGSPHENVTRGKEIGLKAMSLSDHGTISGIFQHLKACREIGVKGIAGIELYVYHKPVYIKDKTNTDNSHMVIWAKNKAGWEQLVRLNNYCNKPDFYYYKPRIHPWNSKDLSGNDVFGLEHFLDGNIMGFSGHQGSHLSDNLFCDLYSENYEERKKKLKTAYAQYKGETTEYYRKFLKSDWKESTCDLALKFEKMFGKGNFFIELQNELSTEDKLPLYIHPLIVECLRIVSSETGIPSMASSDPHYPRKEDAIDQRMMVMINMKETEESVNQKFESSESDIMVFFGSDNFYIHSYEEMSQKFSRDELEMTNKVADMVEEFSIKKNPIIPTIEYKLSNELKYPSITKTNSDKALYEICVNGAKTIKPWEKTNIKKEDYWERLKTELDTICSVGLSDYFLVVWDICNYARANNIMMGWGRGSAGGCLVSYFSGITSIDPLLYKLSFARFYNKARNTKDNIEFPDIDLDFPASKREDILRYIYEKYGEDKVAQIITFQKIAGKAAIKDTVRVKGITNGFDVANEICKFIPDDAAISDEIQEAKDAGDKDYSALRWSVDNVDEVKDFTKHEEFSGIFEQALRIEGKIRGKGRHPSGIIITPDKIDKLLPLSFDAKTKKEIVSFDMNDISKCGGLKIDILGVSILDKLDYAKKLINS